MLFCQGFTRSTPCRISLQAVVDDREPEELYTEFMKERDRKERDEKKKER